MREPKIIQIMPVADRTKDFMDDWWNIDGIALMDDGTLRAIVAWVDEDEVPHIDTVDPKEEILKAWCKKNYPVRKPWRTGNYIINHASCMLIREYVEKEEINPEWLAEESDIDEYILDKILKGRAIPMEREYFRICRALGVLADKFAYKLPEDR